MTRFKDKVALVTGASRGIGKAVAKGLAAEGAHVILLARTQGGLDDAYDEIVSNGGSGTIMRLNLQKLDEVDKLGPSIYERFGGLDIFVGNAGILGTLGPAHQVDPAEFQKVMITNFASNVRLIRTLDPLLRNSSAGRIVFSTAGKYAVEGLAYWSSYMASKAALNAFVKTYAAETKRTNIKANMIYPGPVETDLFFKAFPGGAKFETKKTDDVVEDYLKACAEDCTEHGTLISLG